jgi:hypothetical protein
VKEVAVCASQEPERNQMAASLRNLLILDKYWLGGPGKSLQTWPDFVKGISIAQASSKEIR